MCVFYSNNNHHKVVIEFRDSSWWKAIDKIENIELVFCSVDAPRLLVVSYASSPGADVKLNITDTNNI
jgi:hypothetical protein